MRFIRLATVCFGSVFTSCALACSCIPPPPPASDARRQFETSAEWTRHLLSFWLTRNPSHVLIASVKDSQPDPLTIEQIKAQEKKTGVVLPLNVSPRYAIEEATAVVLRGNFPKDGFINGGGGNCHRRMSPVSEKSAQPKRWIIFANEKFETNVCFSMMHSEENERVLREVLHTAQQRTN